ncbi:MAG: NAD(P)-dependent oxidoreductase [Rhodospirillaceae bacterium]|nr:NAD(P)-dependent oxidoreductase [Rhodospirillaceae bacterium]MBT5457618.1 NAD(P)-dependent oxidoreductase [Rhodospirillaceae bacterium]
MSEHIGFIGLGRMGGPMAGRLLEAGHSLTVHDVSDGALAALVSQGAIAAPSPAAVASAVETVIVSLPTPDIVREVALGSDGLVVGSTIKTFVDLSTSGPDMAREIAAQLDVRGIVSIDAPVSGGVAGAQKGTLAVMASGPAQTVTALSDVLDVIGTVFHVGSEPGLGQTMKLANNLLTASALALSAEAMVMGTKAGLDPQTMLDVINAGSGRNSATQDKFPRAILTRSFDFGFTTGLMQKDVALYRKVAESLGVPTDLAIAVETLWEKTREEFGPDSDFTNIVRGIEKRAGVEVKPRS